MQGFLIKIPIQAHVEGPPLLSCPALQIEAQARAADSLVQNLAQREVYFHRLCVVLCSGEVYQERWIS